MEVCKKHIQVEQKLTRFRGGTISDMATPEERAGIFGWYLLGGSKQGSGLKVQ